MKQLYILGVNGNACDILEMVLLGDVIGLSGVKMGGFLDDKVSKGKVIANGVKVVGALSEAKKLKNAVFVNAIGSPQSYHLKEKILHQMGIQSSQFVSVIHSSVCISSSASIGRGTVILSHTSLGSGVKIGDHVMILQNSVLSHDSQVEDFAVLATSVSLSGSVSVGRSAYLGSQTCVRGNIRIGARSLVGMGSVVVKDIPQNEVWFGNPAAYNRTLNFT